MHGVGGHRDYCYQKALGQALPQSLGLCTFRFDFRNCGESNPVPDPKGTGRTIDGTDYEDIREVVQYFESRGFELFTIVGHSRAALAMFYYLLKTNRKLPCVVNISGRFKTYQYLTDTLTIEGSSVLKRGGYSLVARRYGKYLPQWIPLAELVDFGSYDSNDFADLYPGTKVLTIFGSCDVTVPVRDALYWAEIFERRHTLEIVKGADHNFYGPVLETKNKMDEPPRRSKHSYAPEVIRIVTKYLQQFVTDKPHL